MSGLLPLRARRYLLFDLDGTVIDSSEGIFHSLQYMFCHSGLPIPSAAELSAFIGPSISLILREKYGFPPGRMEEMVALYREEYARQGVFECALYPGVRQLFSSLRAQGKKIAIATKKPERFALMIIEHLNLQGLLDGVFGAPPDDKADHKDSILLHALDVLGCTNKSQALLIGDTRYDCIGARLAGISCVGVDYGFGGRGELLAHGALAVASSAAALEKLLCAPVGEEGTRHAGTF